MARGYVDPATTIRIKNEGAEALKSSDIIVVGALTAVVAEDIPVGAIDEVFIAGQWDAPKKAGEAILPGEAVYYDDSAKTFSKTAITGRAPCYAGDEGAVADAVTMRVILNGR